MKIFAIMLVKNEADIVASVLKDAEKWADKIFILDNGSTDGTWEIIQSLKNNLEENNKLISSLEQLLQSQNQKVMAPYLGMNMPQFLQMPVQPVQQGYYINPSMPMIQSYSLMNNGIQLPMLATMMPSR